jgi:hypothetical protein
LIFHQLQSSPDWVQKVHFLTLLAYNPCQVDYQSPASPIKLRHEFIDQDYTGDHWNVQSFNYDSSNEEIIDEDKTKELPVFIF